LIINNLAFYAPQRPRRTPARLAALDFESSASTSSAIWAYSNLTGANIDIIFITAKKISIILENNF